MVDKLPVWCRGKDWCPITATAKLIGKKWHPVIIHRLLEEQLLGFNELKKEVDGISSKVLSESLDDLREKDLVKRKEVEQKPVRVEYSLTSRGKDLEPVIKEMAKWGKKGLSQAKDRDEELKVSIE